MISWRWRFIKVDNEREEIDRIMDEMIDEADSTIFELRNDEEQKLYEEHERTSHYEEQRILYSEEVCMLYDEEEYK